MKIEASALIKQAWLVVKSQTNVLKAKAADLMKTKAVLLGLLKNKKFIRTVCKKMNGMFHSDGEEYKNTMRTAYHSSSSHGNCRQKMEDFTHTLLDSVDNPRNSVALLLDGRISTSMDTEQLEEEIDNVADIFITRFHAHMRMQKSDSFKQYEDMLRRSV